MEYRTEDYSILWAGAVRCLACGRAAFPTDASWLADGVVIASYERPCAHAPAQVAVMDLRGLGVLPGARPALLDGLLRYVSGRRCAGRNRHGRPCRSFARSGSDYCDHHGEARAAGKPDG